MNKKIATQKIQMVIPNFFIIIPLKVTLSANYLIIKQNFYTIHFRMGLCILFLILSYEGNAKAIGKRSGPDLRKIFGPSRNFFKKTVPADS